MTREGEGQGDGEADREAVETMAFVLALRARGVRDLAVLGAMERVPRDLFAPPRYRDLARTDVALPLACGQTMTTPRTVAAMLAALAPAPGLRVLEVGTGSGYVTALLARMGCLVVSVERFATLADEAAARLAAAARPAAAARLATTALDLDGGQARVVAGDGCAEHIAGVAPGAAFDRVLLNGALPQIPPALAARLAPGGRLVGAVTTADGARLAVVEAGGNGPAAPRLEGAVRLSRLLPGRARVL